MSSRVSGDGERFQARMQFLEGVLRFLVAVQDAERVWLGLPPPRKLEELLDRMQRPTLGMWAEAAEALARTLADAADRPLPDVGVGLLGGGPRPELREGVEGLIALRNWNTHDDPMAALTPELARELLPRSDAPLRALVMGLEPLCALRLVVEVGGQERPDESWVAHLAVHRGEEPAVHDVVLDERVLPDRQPVLVAEDGRVVRAMPWLACDVASPARQVVVLDRWRQNRPTWGEPGLAAAPLDWLSSDALGVSSGSPRAWMEQWQSSRRRRSLSAEVVAKMQPALEPERMPHVRRCRPIRLLGRGGTGAVWLVEDGDRDGAQLALKLLHPALVANREHVERMRNEFELLRRLQVPGVVQVLDVFLDDFEGPCLLMEWVEGRSLAQLAREGPVPLEHAAQIVKGLLETLAITHARGIIHRDIKPSNVILSERGPRLIDFGVARVEDGARLTATADVVGTLAYAAPEQIRGEAVGPPADLFGAGRILQELLTGTEASDQAVVGLPGGMQRLLRRALRPDPAMRFASADEMSTALDEVLAGGWDGCALDVGDDLPGGLSVTLVETEVEEGIFLVHATTRARAPAAVLAPRPEGGARAAFLQRIEGIDQHVRVAQGCLGVRQTDDGVPYVELNADLPLQRARALLSLVAAAETVDHSEPSASTHSGGTVASPEAVDSAPAGGPAPAPTQVSPGKPTKDNSGELALLALGAAAAGALAAHTLGNMSARSSRPGQSGAPRAGAANKVPAGQRAHGGVEVLAGLLEMFAGRSGGDQVKPAATDLAERTHHLGLLLLGLEHACHGLEVSDANWRQAWGTRLGGFLVLAHLADRSGGPFAEVLLTRPERTQMGQLAVQLSRSRGAATPSSQAQMLALRGFLLSLLHAGARPYDARPRKRLVRARVQEGVFQVRGLRTSDGWRIVDVQEA